jgi:glycosyltransferase involved in cell wall biosynthesis
VSTPAGRVLQLVGPSSGGMRRHVDTLAAGLLDAGWAVVVAGPAGTGEAAVVVDVPSSPDPRAWWRARRQLLALASNVDVVHAHGLKAGWLAVLSRVPVPVVVTVHNVVLREHGPAARLLRAAERRLPRHVAAVIATADDVAARMGRRSNVSTLAPIGPPPVPVDDAAAVRARYSIAPTAPLVVTVARLHPQKGLDVLVEALSAVRAAVPDVRALVVGEGPEESAVRSAVASRSLGSVVVLAGARPDAASELAAADVVVVPSRWESGPLVVPEALALGRPVVATAVGFVPRFVVDGVSGRVVPPGDAGALARATIEVLVDRGAAVALAHEGQRIAVAWYGAREASVAPVVAIYERVRR